MNIRMLLPLFCLVGLIAGFLILVSPIYITGGIVCWFHPVPADAWLNHLLGMVFSVLLGLVVIAVSGALAVIFGIVFAAESAVNTRDRAKSIRDPGGSNAPPAATTLQLEDDNDSSTAGKNIDSPPTDEASMTDYVLCDQCGQKLSKSASACPICNKSFGAIPN
jgi:hypothetical protein